MLITGGVPALDDDYPGTSGLVGTRAFQRARVAGVAQMSAPQFRAPINERYFEDYVPDTTFEYGPVSLSEAEIIGFGEKFDPQDIHTNPGKAADGPFGGLIASGWHTASLAMRFYAENYVSNAAVVAPLIIDQLRWLKPVRPGDALWIRVSAIESFRAKPALGLLRVLIEVINQNKETVMSIKTTNLLRSRPNPA